MKIRKVFDNISGTLNIVKAIELDLYFVMLTLCSMHNLERYNLAHLFI